MHTVSLRKVGGSTMIAIPSAFLDQLNIKAGTTVSIEIDHGRLIIEPQKKQRYTLDELLANYIPIELSAEDQAWLDSPPIGQELL